MSDLTYTAPGDQSSLFVGRGMQETIDELKQKVVELQYQPGGPGYLESNDSFEKKQLKDVDSLDKNEQIK